MGLGVLLMSGVTALASEADLKIPDLHVGRFETLGGISAWDLLFYGGIVIFFTLGFSLYMFFQIRSLPVHKSMKSVSDIIFKTCSTYLIQQGKFLFYLFCFIAAAYAIFIFCPKPELAGHEKPVFEAWADGKPVQVAWSVPTRSRGTVSVSTPGRTPGPRSRP